MKGFVMTLEMKMGPKGDSFPLPEYAPSNCRLWQIFFRWIVIGILPAIFLVVTTFIVVVCYQTAILHTHSWKLLDLPHKFHSLSFILFSLDVNIKAKTVMLSNDEILIVLSFCTLLISFFLLSLVYELLYFEINERW